MEDNWPALLAIASIVITTLVAAGEVFAIFLKKRRCQDDTESDTQSAPTTFPDNRSRQDDLLVTRLDAVKDQVQQISIRLKQPTTKSNDIAEVASSLADIIEQTNVLALNAAIQAASFGERGRGFSMVAEEVDRLSRRMAEETRVITAFLEGSESKPSVGEFESIVEPPKGDAMATSQAMMSQPLIQILDLSNVLGNLIVDLSTQATISSRETSRNINEIKTVVAITKRISEDSRQTADSIRTIEGFVPSPGEASS